MKSKLTFYQGALITLLTSVALLFSSPAYAQTAKGVVVDSKGEAIAGAAVLISGTQTGVVTDFEGNFSINAAPGTTLEVSSLGFLTQTVKAAPSLRIVLEIDNLLLEETVVVGYGTMKKKDVTGAMVSVTSNELTANSTLNVTEALEGKAAGVVVTPSDIRPGSTGTIAIRGANTLETREPLIVIDGVIGAKSSLDMLNPQDIESIDILKDASATAIYGARGGDGVILVTTKSGKAGKTTLNYNSVLTIDKIHDFAEPMTAAEAIEWQRWGYYYSGKGVRADQPTVDNDRKLFTSYGVDDITWENILRGWGLTLDEWNNGKTSTTWDASKVKSTDWRDYSDRIGITQEHTLSASGGTDKFHGSASASYLNQKGTNIGQDFKRYTFRVTFEANPISWFSLGSSINLRFADQEYGVSTANSNSSGYGNTLHAKALDLFPYALPYDNDGVRVPYPGGDTLYTTIVEENGKSSVNYLKFGLFADFHAALDFGKMWEPLEGLTFRTVFSPRFNLDQDYQYLSIESVNRMNLATDYVSSQATRQLNWSVDNILNYHKELTNHSFDVTLLQEAISNMSTRMYTMEGNGVFLGMTQKWWGLNTGTVSTLSSPNYNTLTESQVASYMARFNYSLFDKYIITASLRYDGASQLGVGHKWATFPSFALAWRIDQEPFMKSVTWLDQLKLRAGWGKTGNYSVGVYSSKDNLTGSNTVHGSQVDVTYAPPATMANENLRWETTDQYNIGFDFSVLKGRISGVFDLFENYTDGLIFDVTLPSISGYSKTKDNVGKVINRGFDLSLNTLNVVTRDFTWKTNLNLSYSNNEIIELQNGKEDMIDDKLFIGHNSYVDYGYKSAGLWTNSPEDLEEMAKFNANGKNFKPGMVRVVDKNNDYLIDQNNDRFILGNTLPLWNLGLINTFTYKNLELGINMLGAFKYFKKTGNAQAGRKAWKSFDYYNENNTDVNDKMYQYPFFSTSSGDEFYSYRFQKEINYLKVRQISLGYKLPTRFVNQLGLNYIKLTAQVKNPFSVFDTCWWTDSLLGSTYNKSFIFGINVGF